MKVVFSSVMSTGQVSVIAALSVMSTGAKRSGDISCVAKQMSPLRSLVAPVDMTDEKYTQ
ncbi:MAG: hypothetical protein LBT42_05630 [Tannerella sp.]|nr:hypothetical protein [Tannerella sp.]